MHFCTCGVIPGTHFTPALRENFRPSEVPRFASFRGANGFFGLLLEIRSTIQLIHQIERK